MAKLAGGSSVQGEDAGPYAHHPGNETRSKRSVFISIAIILAAMAAILFLLPRPATIKPEGWRLLAIFVGIILALMLRPLPGGAAVLLGVTAIIASGALPIGKALSGYADANAWLVLAAFFIGRAQIKAGLARRIALYFVRLMGHSTLGLAYSVILSDVVLGTAIPSNAARSGGVILPITRSLAEIYDSYPGATAGLLGTFLMMALHQGDTIACALFFTGQASNPIGADFAMKIAHVAIDWPRWLWVASVPGLVSLAVVPWVIFKLAKPGIVRTPEAAEFGRKQLEEMGPRTLQENITLVIFLGVCGLWMTSRFHSFATTTVALMGVSALLATGVLSWREAAEEHGAWDVFIWYGGLLMMATALNDFGITTEFAHRVSGMFPGWNWFWVLLLIGIIYFYAHYSFASITSHMVALFPPFFGVLLALGAPPALAAFVLLFFANLSAGLTHYGTTPAAIIFGTGYVSHGMWWRVGFIVSVVNIFIWLTVGMAWWKMIGVF
jgi:divalent anion:Na+ symporter, DASS family